MTESREAFAKRGRRLMDAAPDLLAALEWAVRNMDRLNADGLPEPDPCVEAARAAIRKATGKEPR